MSEGRARRLAAIDIGTVTARLLIADVSSAGVRQIARSVDITHLGEGLHASGRLSESAMERVATCIARYAREMQDSGVEAFRAVATSASRDAGNGQEFLALLESRGVRPEIIAGQREAELSFAGAKSDDVGEGVLVNDIGGGSTEIVVGNVGTVGTAPQIVASASLNVGSRRVTEMFMREDPPTTGEISAARSFIHQELTPYFQSLEAKPRRCISLAGTATTLSAIRQRMAVYDPESIHGSIVTAAALSETIVMLSGLDLSRRREVVGLHPDRASVIIAGALVLEVLMDLAGLDSTEISEHDILYGILLDTYGSLS
ncbi:MAG: Ppx/GppA phosphatase family protein [Actinomycetota bacterium]|jgi:exopolyphosphatase/guanosine-5'-triphosphate,3'-diphosphate pyrophosphatase|nr:Ppx/GppA phosphatase family protein [Actinomycetota bacterium]